MASLKVNAGDYLKLLAIWKFQRECLLKGERYVTYGCEHYLI